MASPASSGYVYLLLPPVYQASLRFRLILAFLAMVGLIVFVGLADYLVHDSVREDVARLRMGAAYDLTTHDAAKVGLEVKGYWHPAGAFVAEEFEPQTPQDPRLRGPLQAVSLAPPSISLYGVEVEVNESTENGDDESEPVNLTTLRTGDRVEVKCEVEEGRWVAKKLYTSQVNRTNKIKGMVTRMELDGAEPSRIYIEGLPVLVELNVEEGPQSALARVEEATRMIVELQNCRAAAYELAGQAIADSPEARVARDGAVERLVSSNARLCEMIKLGFGADTSTTPGAEFKTYLEGLHEDHIRLARQIDELTALAASEDGRGLVLDYLHGSFDPLVANRMLPKLTAYLWEGDEALGDQLRGMLDKAELTTSLAMGASLLAVALAFVLGALVYRSVSEPILELQDAAARFGEGQLETRIQVRRRDELGMLGEAFNNMAEALSSTTVSMESLDAVFDTMTAALLLFTPEGKVARVNDAACALCGQSRAELLGKTFGEICKLNEGEQDWPMVTSSPGERGASSVERAFLHSSGGELPVALSCAQLATTSGESRGFVCVAQDLRQQKLTEERIRDSLAEKELLLREVHHRVKNNLQVISSLLAMQQSDGSPEMERRMQESQHRIRTIALIHEQLYRSEELANINLRTYLQVLVDHLLDSYGVRGSVELSLEVEDLGLDLESSISIGLIVNELVTNSLKYAFPGRSGGRLVVGLHMIEDGKARLLVADDGAGLSKEPRKGPASLGTSLVRTLARQLKGRVFVDGEGGTKTQIDFDLARLLRAASQRTEEVVLS